MTKRKPSTSKVKEYYIKGKQEIKDTEAPVVSDEFIDFQDGNEYRGQSIDVQSETTLESDLGTGSPYILRTYEFKTNPELLNDVVNRKTAWPTAQEFFNQHARGIEGMMWGDGMSPVKELEPRVVFTRDKKKYLIMVWAQPSLGQVINEKPYTLGEISRKNYESRTNKNKV